MRLFIAIPLDGEVRRAALRLQREMQGRGVKGNFTRPENLHLTLAFIGEYPDPDAVLDAMADAPFDPVRLRLSGIGAFGDLWWLGFEPNAALDGYASALRRALSHAGIPFDRKRFRPHVTLVRRAVLPSAGMPALSVPPAAMTAESAVLFRSDRGKDGMVYTKVGR